MNIEDQLPHPLSYERPQKLYKVNVYQNKATGNFAGNFLLSRLPVMHFLCGQADTVRGSCCHLLNEGFVEVNAAHRSVVEFISMGKISLGLGYRVERVSVLPMLPAVTQ